jgi:alpha-glucoside transport system substrate-binding protein
MNLYDRRQRQEVDQLVEDFTQNGLSRREFMKRAVAIGFSASAAGALLAACGGSSSVAQNVKSVDVLNVWGGDEQASFKAVVAPFTQQNGITVNVDSTRDLDATLTTRIQGNNPPGIAVLPNPAKMQQLASQRKLIALDSFLDMNTIKSQYAQSWIDLGTYQNKLYAIFYKTANKATVWYSPQQFTANNYQVPANWDALIALSNQIASSGKYPWSMGVESGSASGWPATDWVASIFLNESGPDKYDQWVGHKIPWTDASVKSAFQKFGAIVHGNHYINGAPQSILATGFQQASYPPFQNPPTAFMYYEGDFTAGFITGQFKGIQPGTGFDFFPFPAVGSAQPGVTIGADVVVALKNDNAVQALVKYLATPQAQEIWVKRGGFTSANKGVDLTAYPDPIAKKSAQQLVSASVKFGAGDIMPPQVQQQWWKGMLDFIGDASKLDSVLSNIESVAQTAYR